MSLETQVAGLVTATNNLTGTVNEKIADIDSAKNAAVATMDARVATFNNTELPAMQDKLTGKNLIINGGFDVWQRGTSTTSGGFAADRWYINQLSNVMRSGDVPAGEGFKYSLRWQVNSSDPYMRQPLENIMHLIRGQVVTLSFWAKATSGGFTTGQYMTTNGGSGGYHAQGLPVGESLTTTWTRYSRTFTVSTGHDVDALYTDIRFDVDEGVASDIYITGIQLELGSVATNFDYRSYGEELALCQRYYQTYVSSYHTGMVYNSSTITSSLILLPVAMRTSPTFEWISPYHITGANHWGVYGATNGWSNVGYPPTAQNVSAGAFRIQMSSLGGVSNGTSYLLNGGFALDAEI